MLDVAWVSTVVGGGIVGASGLVEGRYETCASGPSNNRVVYGLYKEVLKGVTIKGRECLGLAFFYGYSTFYGIRLSGNRVPILRCPGHGVCRGRGLRVYPRYRERLFLARRRGVLGCTFGTIYGYNIRCSGGCVLGGLKWVCYLLPGGNMWWG